MVTRRQAIKVFSVLMCVTVLSLLITPALAEDQFWIITRHAVEVEDGSPYYKIVVEVIGKKRLYASHWFSMQCYVRVYVYYIGYSVRVSYHLKILLTNGRVKEASGTLYVTRTGSQTGYADRYISFSHFWPWDPYADYGLSEAWHYQHIVARLD